MPEVEWRKLRADQLRDLARQDAIVILPVASLEQHGPHLPVEVDTMLGETVALRTAAEGGGDGHADVVLPVLWTGISEHHMSFGGTVTLDNRRVQPRWWRAWCDRCCGTASAASCC